MANVILVSAQVPIGPYDSGLLWVGDWVGPGLDNSYNYVKQTH